MPNDRVRENRRGHVPSSSTGQTLTLDSLLARRDGQYVHSLNAPRTDNISGLQTPSEDVDQALQGILRESCDRLATCLLEVPEGVWREHALEHL